MNAVATPRDKSQKASYPEILDDIGPIWIDDLVPFFDPGASLSPASGTLEEDAAEREPMGS